MLLANYGLVEAAINEDDFVGMKKESDYFLKCLMNPQREAMIHIFLVSAASKISDIPKDTPLLPINQPVLLVPEQWVEEPNEFCKCWDTCFSS